MTLPVPYLFPSMALRLLLLGGARIQLDGEPVTGRPAQRRRIAVLALLARSVRRTLTRERILAYLWADSSPDAARRLLSEAIYVLRRDLGDAVISTVGDEITLSSQVECDVDEFLDAVVRNDHARALTLYSGPLLDGWFVRAAPDFERWVEAERVELAATHVKSLWILTQHRETVGDWAGAAAGWQAIIRVDPYGSTAVLNAARALVSAGEPAAALQQLATHETLLRDDLGVGLDADLSALARDIREGRVQPRRVVPSAISEAASPRLMAHLETLSSAVFPQSDVDPVKVRDPALEPKLPRPKSESIWQLTPKRLHVQFAGAAAALVFAFGSWLVASRDARSSDVRVGIATHGVLDPRRIAVLYFEDQTPDHSLRYIADGLAEGLIRELAEVPSLRVLSRGATSRFRPGVVPADSIGRILGAGTIISATLRQSGKTVQVLARLVDAMTGEQIATVVVEQPHGELFALEDSLAARTAVALRRRLGDDVRLRDARRAAAVGGRNDKALEFVLRAERLRKDTEAIRSSLRRDAGAIASMRERLQAADSLLALAESIDPTWTRPSIERGWVAVTAGRIEHGTARVMALAPGLAHAERALTTLRERAPDDLAARASALYLRGLLRVRTATAVQTFRPEQATIRDGESDLESAIRADSMLAGAWAALSASRWVRGDFAGSSEAARRALAADAFLENANDVIGWAWRSAYFQADGEAAMRWCRRGRDLLPDDPLFLECELTISRLDAAGLTTRRPDPQRAWTLVRELERIDPPKRAAEMGHPYSPIYRRLVAAAVSAAAGQRDTARRVLEAELARVRGDPELSTDILYDAAFLHITLGNAQRARSLLDSYVRARPDLDSLIARDPTMRAARPRAARESVGLKRT